MANLNLASYVASLSKEQQSIYHQLVALLRDVYPVVEETLFAKQPYFYLKEHESIKFHNRPSVMMTFFNDHVNIFTVANQAHQMRLSTYQFTAKHTLQIRLNQALDADALKALFSDALVLNHNQPAVE